MVQGALKALKAEWAQRVQVASRAQWARGVQGAEGIVDSRNSKGIIVHYILDAMRDILYVMYMHYVYSTHLYDMHE